jgi:hypothetical protein
VTKKLLLGGSVALLAIGVAVAAFAAPTSGPVPGTNNSARVSGSDRYETSLAISQAIWTPSNTYIVFIATGENYPDALSLGASTAGAGPILLVHKDQLPTGVAAEVQRLAPCAIIVAGGTGVVADSVIQQIDPSADPSSTKCQTLLNTSSPTATMLRAQVSKNHD